MCSLIYDCDLFCVDAGFTARANSMLQIGLIKHQVKMKDLYLFLVIREAIVKQMTRNWLKDSNLLNPEWKQ